MAEASAPSPRVIQMIDENKEQLRNLFRNYNVLDVQPAISVRPPDDMSALQVPLVTPPPQAPGQEDPLEREMATHPSTLAWKNPRDRGV